MDGTAQLFTIITMIPTYEKKYGGYAYNDKGKQADHNNGAMHLVTDS
jgi:hypothetical protein